MICSICGYKNEDKKGFATHLQIVHKLSSKNYTIKYLYNTIMPLCPICHKETRYVAFTFKKYCKEHSNHAESEAGSIGGKIKKSWNKGKTKHDDSRIMDFSIKYTGSGNPFYGKRHPRNMIDKIKNRNLLPEEKIKERLSKREEDFEFYFDYNNYNSRQYQYINVKCKKCGFEDEKTLMSLERGTRCVKCFPLYISSQPEQEIEEYIHSLGFNNIIRNSRDIINPKELDIYIPDNNFAIEYNGLFWHLEEKVGKRLHLDKTKRCLEKDIKLFHIFSDEWNFKKDIVKSMICHKLGISNDRYYARNCYVKEIDNKTARDFFNKTHIAGSGGTIKKSFGIILKNTDELVGCLALKIPYKKKNENNEKIIENARFSTKLNTSVIGGFSKLLKYVIIWAKEQGYAKIKSFADRRFGEGKVYEKCGFKLIGATKSNYWYTDTERRYFRTLFRAKEGKTEREIAEENGVFKIYGCGSNIYILDLQGE